MNFDTFLHEAACDVTHFAQPHSYEVIEQRATDVGTARNEVEVFADFSRLMNLVLLVDN